MNLKSPLEPRRKGGILRVIIPGRISTPGQDPESINAQHEATEKWLEETYKAEKETRRLGDQASGWVADRESMDEAKYLIESSDWDVVLATELREIYRNPGFQWTFVQTCLDAGTRFISVTDGIDTLDPDWEIYMHVACLRYGMTVPETRRRVRNKANFVFSRGGMALTIKFGYRKLTKEEAATGDFGPVGLRIAKVSECTPVICEMRDRILRGDGPPSVTRWLTDAGINPGPYVKSGRWTPKLVLNLLRDPILSGRRMFRRQTLRLIYKTGLNKVIDNPEKPEVKEYSELAHMTVEEHNDLLAALDARKSRSTNPNGPPKGRDNPLWNHARSQTLWPGQHAVCGVCGGRMYRMGTFLRCRNSVDARNRTCWNCVQVNIATVRGKVLPWVISQVQSFPEFSQLLADAAWNEYLATIRRSTTAASTRSVLPCVAAVVSTSSA